MNNKLITISNDNGTCSFYVSDVLELRYLRHGVYTVRVECSKELITEEEYNEIKWAMKNYCLNQI